MAQPKEFFTNIDLLQNQIKGIAIDNLVADPGTPVLGQFWFNTTSNTLKFYDGSTVHTIANLNDLAGGVTFKGGYDASTNTPDLDTTPISGIVTGDLYVVTADGLFFTEQVRAGDSLIAEVDDPTTLADWILVQSNIDFASDTVAGIIRIATQAEVDAGVLNNVAVVPSTLQDKLNGYAAKYTESGITDFASGGSQTYVVTHNLNVAGPLQVKTSRDADGEEIVFDIAYTDANNLTLSKSGPAIPAFSVSVVG